ncbi:7-cyano-7-deazaguanine synthase QueC [Gallaecimonas sp. GXIMD1310]|uniref:7-cyano-7-deazaguanine synthase QueC n=1 Tax=Gallaecimonas sp. GXIMD1310 TaxID=3131926 RepID=UPI0032493B9B
MTNAVVIYSGGMDSYTVLHQALADGMTVHALSFNYGQRHVKELDVARRVTTALGIAHDVVDISAIQGLISNSALTSDADMPHGHYAEASMKQTVVPNRNMILLSLAIGKAVSIGAGKVYYGAHGGDHAIYPDCRPEFVAAMNNVAGIANYEPVTIETPFLHASKGDILGVGLKLGLDYSQTWTCYEGGDAACGRCGACQERLEAFREYGLDDPLPYLSREIL